MKIDALSPISIDVQPYNGLIYMGFFALGLSDRRLISFDMSVELANLLLTQMESGKIFFLKDGSREFGTIYFTPVDSEIIITWALRDDKSKTKNLPLAYLDENQAKQFKEHVMRSIRKVIQ